MYAAREFGDTETATKMLNEYLVESQHLENLPDSRNQSILTNIKRQLSSPVFYARLAVPAIKDYISSHDPFEYTRLWNLMENHVEPDLQYMEFEIRYRCANGHISQAYELIVECSQVFEHASPRRPALSVINIVFFAAFRTDMQLEMEQLVMITKKLGHDYHMMARDLCKWYIQREMSDCVLWWVNEYAQGSCNDIVANNILWFIMEHQGFHTGVKVRDYC